MNKLLILFSILLVELITPATTAPRIKKNSADLELDAISFGTWVYHKKFRKHYFFSDEPLVHWDYAENACINMNMTLLNIETQEENDSIFDIIRTHPDVTDMWRWISGKRLAFTTDWIWTGTGELFSEYTNWGDEKELPDITIESCSNIAGFYNSWDADSCDDTLMSFICEDFTAGLLDYENI